MLNTSLLTKYLSGSGESELDFLSKFHFQLLHPVRNFLICLEPVLLYTCEVAYLLLLELSTCFAMHLTRLEFGLLWAWLCAPWELSAAAV